MMRTLEVRIFPFLKQALFSLALLISEKLTRVSAVGIHLVYLVMCLSGRITVIFSAMHVNQHQRRVCGGGAPVQRGSVGCDSVGLFCLPF